MTNTWDARSQRHLASSERPEVGMMLQLIARSAPRHMPALRSSALIQLAASTQWDNSLSSI